MPGMHVSELISVKMRGGELTRSVTAHGTGIVATFESCRVGGSDGVGFVAICNGLLAIRTMIDSG